MKFREILENFVKSYFNIKQRNFSSRNITESKSFKDNQLENIIWNRGQTSELIDFYSNRNINADNFWSSNTKYSKVRKIHTGLPSLIVKTLLNITLNDLSEISCSDENYNEILNELLKDINLNTLLNNALKNVLILGDGAFRIIINNGKLNIEFISGEDVEFIYDNNYIYEIVFKKNYIFKDKEYILLEKYGNGYIKYNLYDKNLKEYPLDTLEALSEIKDIYFYKDGQLNTKLNLAIPFKIWDSNLYENRGASIFDNKKQAFDAYDEITSEWMDAIRKGRAYKFVPSELIPRDGEGNLLNSSDFSNDFIKLNLNGYIGEDVYPKPEIIQPNINVENYLTTYITVLDLVLQGIISPSTLGIDNKKLDNAEAQREKEKTTLYTRATIIDSITSTLKDVLKTLLETNDILYGKEYNYENELNIIFGEYANPSFEAVIETLSKAAPGKQILTFERIVEETYGRSLSNEEKQEEVKKLKEINNLEIYDDPYLNVKEEELE